MSSMWAMSRTILAKEKERDQWAFLTNIRRSMITSPKRISSERWP
jgi:hypothetical protein